MPKRSQHPDAAQAANEAANAEGAAAKSGPAHELRLGRIKAVIWANQSEGGTRYNVTLRRIFKREGGPGWEQSDSFGRDDLPAVMEVSRQAWLWIYAQPST
jgi:hypothetical protein